MYLVSWALLTGAVSTSEEDGVFVTWIVLSALNFGLLYLAGFFTG